MHSKTLYIVQSLLMEHVILHSSMTTVHVLLTLHILAHGNLLVILYGGPYFPARVPYFTGRIGTRG